MKKVYWRPRAVSRQALLLIAVISIVITAAYILRAIGRVFFGEIPAELKGHMHDITRSEKVALGVLSTIMVAIGVAPGVIVPVVQSGVNVILKLVGGA